MATIAHISLDVTWWGIDYFEDLIVGLGHTMTRFDEEAVTASNLSTFDLIVVNALFDVNTTTLAGFLEDYMSVDSIPIMFLTDMNVLADDNFITGQAFVQNLMGVNPVNYRNTWVGGVDGAGYGINVPETQFLNHEVSMMPDAHLNAMGQGFLQPSFQGTFEGESFVWGARFGSTGEIVTAQPGAGQVAGAPMVRLTSSFWGNFRELVATVIKSGDKRVGAKTGTFPQNVGWIGSSGNILTGNHGHMTAAIVRWCLGEYDSLTTYSTVAKSSAFRYPSAALDAGLTGTTYGSSSIDWTETTPTNTSVTVQASLDGEAFTTVANGGAIPGLTAGDPLAAKRLTIRVELATTDGVSTPQFSGLSVSMDSQQPALTATPDDYFQEGHLLWTKGGNKGLSMEVKSYDDATRLLTLFLQMRGPVTVGDEFTILPGCDKTIATCNAKFGNSINFQGEPDVPGEDQIMQTPDPI